MTDGEQIGAVAHSRTAALARPLTATYRLQLNAGFTLHDARARVPYLHALGVSHLYCSPVLAARAGSTHGYDVADPTQVNPELGGDAAFVALAETAHAHGMGLVLDIVPNHMGIGADNPFWDDLLAHGPTSRYASWFDVQWRAETRRLANRVHLPVLGDSLDAVLERDELALEVTGLGARVRYFDHHFPIDPATYPPEVELALRDPSALPAVKEWGAGEDGRERMRALLARQHYVLDFWRTASRDINYRRFFDVNELIALRVENAEVFEATHRTTLQFVADGLVDGLRIDHIDGLLEPRRYLERLRAAVDERRPPSDGARFPIVVEKILASGETLPTDWPVDGTTGYEFMTTLEDVFIDPAGYAQLEARYRGGRDEPDFHAVAYASKRAVLRNALNADVRRIAPMLASLARQAKWPSKPIAAYAGAIVELVAALPVYRTYLDAERPEAEGSDRAMLERAFREARERGHADAEALDALERALLGAWRAAAPELARARMSFVLRLQQLSGPAAAKGVEDTALYVYAPLASRNEVGGDPGVPVEGAVDRLHALLAARAAQTPRALNATNTHDTKRSADVRSRLDALSEHPASWERRLRLWRRRHRELRRIVRGRLAPTRTTDNFIYQALVGVWPIGTGTVHEDAAAVAELRERLTAYIQKALREAKVSTSWTDPDAEYEDAVAAFLAALLDRASPERYLRDVAPLVAEVGATEMWNALARLVVHLTAPGVPDVYRGDELWFQALVDPDNRRPVDWETRAARLDEIRRACEAGRDGIPSLEALRGWRDGAETGWLKLYLTTRLLRIRRDDGAAFVAGSYQPLAAEGTHAARVVAFRRGEGVGARIALVPRLTGGLGAGAPIGARWEDTLVRSGDEGVGEWRCLLSGVHVPAHDGAIAVTAALAELPVAVLARASVV
ncbi:MAG TPA: malto-oligosyltrehalose synthase [Gemmatimonadaceae bacterium]|nr:malto-oligosyltrehalose synthase [Gemmatimonadaceae bacterium]